jgi:hypothetical protein
MLTYLKKTLFSSPSTNSEHAIKIKDSMFLHRISTFSAHWFLAVICFPGLEGLVRLADGEPITAECLRQQRQASVRRKDGQSIKQFTIGATTVTVSQNVSAQTVSLLKEKVAKTVRFSVLSIFVCLTYSLCNSAGHFN